MNGRARSVARFFSKLSRFFEIWDMFGPFHFLTWKTLFPPFKGWDIGCGYCALEDDAIKAKHCKRAEAFGYHGQCGTTEKDGGA